VIHFGHTESKQVQNYFSMLVLHLHINYTNNAKCISAEVSVCLQAWSHSVTQLPISAHCHPFYGHPPLVITFLCQSTLKFVTWNSEFFFLFAQPLLLLPPLPKCTHPLRQVLWGNGLTFMPLNRLQLSCTTSYYRIFNNHLCNCNSWLDIVKYLKKQT